MFLCPPPQCNVSQPMHHHAELKAKVKAKLEKVMKTGYVEIADSQMVESIMYMFDVVKGEKIWMVYDGSKSGLNDTLWAPWFALPNIDTMTR